MQFETAVGEFVSDLRLAGRVARTVGGHSLELARFGRWLELNNVCWSAATTAQLKQYTRLRAHLGHSSRSNMLCSLRVFYAWSVEQGHIGRSPAAWFKTPKKPRPVPRSLSLDQVAQLLRTFASSPGRTCRRDEALLLTAVYAGLRAKELAMLLWDDVDLKAGTIRITLSKMGHGRTLPIHPDLCVLLASWRTLQALEGFGPVFSLDGESFNGNRVGKIARKWSKASGVRFSAHVLRHTFATHALRGSRDLYGVSKALGHSEVRQTEIYISTDPEYMRAAVASLPRIGEW